MKDSVIIKDGIIYFGRLNLSENMLDAKLNLNRLKKINGSSIKTIQLNSRNRRVIITDNIDVQETISLDKAIDMTSFINEILDSFSMREF